jgi:hypothetical protein
MIRMYWPYLRWAYIIIMIHILEVTETHATETFSRFWIVNTMDWHIS